MKALFAILILASSTFAFAGTNTLCTSADKSMTASFFDLGEQKSIVQLSVANRTLKGACVSQQGAIELSVICNVLWNSDSGYKLKVFSIGGRMLVAQVAAWSMAGETEPQFLTCSESASRP